MNPDIAACAGIVQKGDPDRFVAIMSGPVHLREKLFPLYAMNVEVARAPWVTQESMIAEMRLQWWRDALEEIAKRGEVRRHEVVTPLSDILNPQQAEALYALIEARRWDIYKDPFVDASAFEKHLNDTAGVLLGVAAELAGASDTQHIQTIGRVDGLARWFQAIPALEAQGRIPLVDGRASAVVELAKGALADFETARTEIRRVDRDVAAVLRLTWQSKMLLKQAVKNPQLVQEGNLINGEFSRKVSLLWKSLNANW